MQRSMNPAALQSTMRPKEVMDSAAGNRAIEEAYAMKFRELPSLLHGGDYNADQWMDRPDILEKDMELMKKCGVNVVTLGVFSWSSLEPEEGVYTFEWLDNVMERCEKNGIYVILATPSGGKPPWLAQKYPEVMRTDANRVRHLYGERENHCNSSPVYRELVRRIDEKLAERYARHPALIMWHISNEMYGKCHCRACQKNFQGWLKKKYGTLDKLNEQYWSRFWSHTYTDWAQLESPAAHGETAIHGLALDYQRFYSDLSIDFLQMEIDAVKKYNPEIPTTTNLFHFNSGIDNRRLADHLDFVAWDAYPRWHCGENKASEWKNGVEAAFGYDACRSYKGQPFLLMETTPSSTNGFPVSKLKRPGVHMLSCMQAVAGGADTVQYFQWRQSLGDYEKFHGAVISHNGSGNTRVFRDVAEVGRRLAELSELKNAGVESQAALVYDWDNLRGLEEQCFLRRGDRQVDRILKEHYEAFLRNYVSVDIISQRDDFSRYKVVAAPMLYMLLPGTAEKIRRFVAEGGVFVTTFYSGLVNENDLCYECFPPYSLNDVTGVREEEIDCLCDGEENHFTYNGKRYSASLYCDLVEAEGETVASYEEDFYAGRPALVKNSYGRGESWYMACRGELGFLVDFYRDLFGKAGVRRIIAEDFAEDVMVKERCSENKRFLFLMNFSSRPRELGEERLKGYEVKILEEEMPD